MHIVGPARCCSIDAFGWGSTRADDAAVSSRVLEMDHGIATAYPGLGPKRPGIERAAKAVAEQDDGHLAGAGGHADADRHDTVAGGVAPLFFA